MKSDRQALDRQNRSHALQLAVESHAADGHTNAVLTTATRYLEWLRQPFPAATLTLRVGNPTTK
jgi:hypothetical protein